MIYLEVSYNIQMSDALTQVKRRLLWVGRTLLPFAVCV